jgi:hypothetical protein
MQGALASTDVTNTVDVERPEAVARAIREIFERRYPGVSFELLDRVFTDLERLFQGRYPGYLACETPYHDLRHTLDVTLTTARLIDGHERVKPYSQWLGAERALLGVVVAALHDSGYLRATNDRLAVHGAQYTRIHVTRSAVFLGGYLNSLGMSEVANVAERIVHFTGLERSLDSIEVDDWRDRALGCIVGSADVIAQMADRCYLEKCRDHLYRELVIAGIAGEPLEDGSTRLRYESPADLLAQTPKFHDEMFKGRLRGELQGMFEYAGAYFGGPNPYVERIGAHMRHLRRVLDQRLDAELRRESRSSTQEGSPEFSRSRLPFVSPAAVTSTSEQVPSTRFRP